MENFTNKPLSEGNYYLTNGQFAIQDIEGLYYPQNIYSEVNEYKNEEELGDKEYYLQTLKLQDELSKLSSIYETQNLCDLNESQWESVMQKEIEKKQRKKELIREISRRKLFMKQKQMTKEKKEKEEKQVDIDKIEIERERDKCRQEIKAYKKELLKQKKNKNNGENLRISIINTMEQSNNVENNNIPKLEKNNYIKGIINKTGTIEKSDEGDIFIVTNSASKKIKDFIQRGSKLPENNSN